MLRHRGIPHHRGGVHRRAAQPNREEEAWSGSMDNRETEDQVDGSPRYVEAPASLESFAAQLLNIQLNMENLRNQRYDDCIELVAFINDIQYAHSEIMEQLDGLCHQHRCTNNHLRGLEMRVKHIDFHMHEYIGHFAAPPVIPPNPPP